MMGNGWTISQTAWAGQSGRAPLRVSVPPCLRASRHGFTLTEILVVIVIMTIMLVIAVPAFNYVTGSRSIEAGENLAAAMIQRARNASLDGGRFCGVLFYQDPVSQRTTMTVVEVTADTGANNTGDGDLTQRYKAWQSNVNYKGPGVGPTPPPFQPDRVIFMTRDGNFGDRMITYLWEAIQDSSGQRPPTSISYGTVYPGGYANTYWRIVAPGNTYPLDPDDINAGTQQLPQGVRIQVMVDPKGVSNVDRYMTTGLILFDPQGRLAAGRPFQIQLDTTLADAMKLQQPAPTGSYLYSGIGLAIFDRSAFEASHPATTDNGVFIDAFKASDGDGIYTPPHLSLPSDTGGYTADEQNEEKWIDQNASRVMIGRSNGILMGGTP